MTYEKALEAWAKADIKRVKESFRRARGYLPGIQRYWRIYEDTYRNWLTRDLSALELELFGEAFRAFDYRIRFVNGNLGRVNAVLTEGKFWEALDGDRQAFFGTLLDPRTTDVLSQELALLGFNRSEVTFLTKVFSNESSLRPTEFDPRTGIEPGLASLRKLVDEHRKELVLEKMMVGEASGGSPSSRALLRRIMSTVVAGFLICYDLLLVQPPDARSVVSGAWNATSAHILDDDDPMDRLPRYVRNRDLRLRGELDLLSQRDPSGYHRISHDLNEFILQHYIAVASREERKVFERYLMSMEIDVNSLKQRARRILETRTGEFFDTH